MFIHVGDSKIIFTSDLVGIFVYDNISEDLNRDYLHKEHGSGLSEWPRETSPKSFLVTTSKSVYSPVSSHTLAERFNALNL